MEMWVIGWREQKKRSMKLSDRPLNIREQNMGWGRVPSTGEAHTKD